MPTKENPNFIIALKRIESGELSVQKLQNFLENAKAGKGNINEEQMEMLIDVIEVAMRKANPMKANKLIGPVNRKTREKLDDYRVFLEAKYPEMVRKNKHKSHVKVGGNVISGDVRIYDYISFKGENDLIAHIAFFQRSDETPLEIIVTLTKYERKNSKRIKENRFPPEDFDLAKSDYDTFLKEAMTVEVLSEEL